MDAPNKHRADLMLAKIASGDVNAAQQCIDRYGDEIWTLARRLSPSWNEAEQAVQNIFREIWQQSAHYLPAQGSEKTFIIMIARRYLITSLRSTDWRPSPNNKSNETNALAADTPQEVRSTVQTFTRLTAEQQNVLAWGIVYGHSYNAIATATGLPVAAVKEHMRSSLLQIREAMISSSADAN